MGYFVARLQRSFLMLTVAVCSTVLIYWRQQIDQAASYPAHSLYRSDEPQWSWVCRNDSCKRLTSQETNILQSLPTCNMLCASTQLWPQPTGSVSLSKTAVAIKSDQFHLKILTTPSNEVDDHLYDAFSLMKEDIRNLERTGSKYNKNNNVASSRSVLVQITVYGTGDTRMRLDTDESYKLSTTSSDSSLLVDIHAYSFCGARHGLETLSQLIWMDPYVGSLLTLEAVNVKDAPKFKYRGLLLDTARNYFPVAELMRTIDAMGASKLNTFHWHVSDSQSFPMRFNSAPQLADNGAYGPDDIYTPDDVKAIVRRARLRGIRVLIEVDAPAHVGRAWSWGPISGLGDLAYCVETEPWHAYCGEPPCGQLNPRNTHVYDILERIYAEIIQLTGVDDLFHIGGDEVWRSCWQKYINYPWLDLWLDFTRKAMQALERANGGKAPNLTLIWSSLLTQTPHLERLDRKKLGIQVWGASHWPKSRAILDAGYSTVISHLDAWYLDCGFGSWRDNSDSHCSYRSWQQMYQHRPWTAKTAGFVSGGEACQWTEQLDPGGLDSRLWPRAAAVAERLWSDRLEGTVADVYIRLDTHRSRLVAKGVKAAPLWPRWCSHNPYACL